MKSFTELLVVPGPERPAATYDRKGRHRDRRLSGHRSGLVAGYRRQGWAVVTSARTITPSEDPGVLTVTGDIADAEIAERIIGGGLRRFGRIDTLVNSAGVFTAKPFTDYTAADYARVVGGSLTGFFWLTQWAIAEMATRYGGHVVSVLATLGEVADPGTPAVLAALTNGGLTAATTEQRQLDADPQHPGTFTPTRRPKGTRD
jgi:NAD(P)-dependent dehydrogenase (short-subunit alcohol dehydrogenase family)